MQETPKYSRNWLFIAEEVYNVNILFFVLQ